MRDICLQHIFDERLVHFSSCCALLWFVSPVTCFCSPLPPPFPSGVPLVSSSFKIVCQNAHCLCANVPVSPPFPFSWFHFPWLVSFEIDFIFAARHVFFKLLLFCTILLFTFVPQNPLYTHASASVGVLFADPLCTCFVSLLIPGVEMPCLIFEFHSVLAVHSPSAFIHSSIHPNH